MTIQDSRATLNEKLKVAAEAKVQQLIEECSQGTSDQEDVAKALVDFHHLDFDVAVAFANAREVRDRAKAEPPPLRIWRRPVRSTEGPPKIEVAPSVSEKPEAKAEPEPEPEAKPKAGLPAVYHQAAHDRQGSELGKRPPNDE